MNLNKINQNLIVALAFLSAILLPLLLWFLLGIPLIKSNLDGLAIISIISCFSFIIVFLQFFILLLLSFKLSNKFNKKNSKNILYNIKFLSSVLLLWVIFDSLFYTFYSKKYNMYVYFIFFSLTKNFIPIYIVAIINSVRLRIQEKNRAP